MKKLLLTFVLLVGIAVGLFAQNLTYQAVVRDNNQQLVVNTAVKATVTITFSTGTPATYQAEVNGSTNIHGLLSIEFGGDALNGRNWEGATIAVKVVKANDESTVYVNDGARPVSAVPYALSVNGQSIQNYLTEHHYVDQTELDSRHYLTSDSAVITTMQGDIAALQNASMDCNDVKNCIKDTLSQYTPTTDLCNVLSNCQFSEQSLADLLQGLTNQISDLQEQVEYLSSLPHGGGDTPAEVADGQPCPGAATVSDGTNTYNTVKIGNQCWMKENLRTNVDGSVYPKKNNGRDELSEDEKVTYGRLYTWNAMMKGAPSTEYPAGGTNDTIVHGICPVGWHVPSNAEWDTLTTYVNIVANGYRCGDDGTIAKALSSTTGWSEGDNACDVGEAQENNNATGFSAVPAGYCFYGGSVAFGDYAFFWSATQYDDIAARCRRLGSDDSDVCSRYDLKENYGFSVRCLRDAGVGGGTTPSAPGGDNACCSELGARLDSLEHVISSQDSTINALNEQVNPFTCGSSKVKDVDNNEYNTVAIGNQCWTKENLRTTTHTYGQVWTKTDADSAIYGRYYDWQAAMQIEASNTTDYTAGEKHRGICPTGWHVPSDAEWNTLTNYVKGKTEYVCGEDTNNIANALSSPTGWSSNTSEGCNAGNTGDKANATVFSAVPAGGRFRGSFGDFGLTAYFWSATQAADFNAWYRSLGSNVSNVGMFNASKGVGFSVRCLRDAGVGGPAGGNEIAGTTPSAPGGDNACCSELGARLDSLEHVISSQDSTINALNEQVNPFTCGSSKVKDVDNNEYNTVAIGSQCWTKENLRTLTKRNGVGNIYTENTIAGYNAETYGYYYDWTAVMQNESGDKVQGICPTGWHVPSDAEWNTLTTYVNTEANGYRCGGDGTIANALSSPTGWNSSAREGCNAGNMGDKANATGFSAVPAGYGHLVHFEDFGTHARFWSATQDGGNKAWCRQLTSTISLVGSISENKVYGFSVRCLRDAGVGGTPGENETAGTTPSAPATMSCEQVMECMGDTLGKLNEKIEAQGQTITTQGHTIDSLAHLVDSLSNLTPGGGDTPTEVADGQPCPDAPTVSDGTNTYNTVKIGNQCWMAQNLRTNVDGSEYPKKNYGTDDLTADEQIIYGRLYPWNAVTKGASTNYPANPTDTLVHGICPAGWHVPSNAEWDTLTKYVKLQTEYVCEGCSGTDGGLYTYCIAKALSQPTGWSNTGTGCNAGNTGEKSNATGFAAVPAGGCFGDWFYDFGGHAYFWSATQVGDGDVWCRDLASGDSYVGGYCSSKDYGYSVRCLRDAGVGGGDTPTEVADGQPCLGAATVSDGTNTYNTVKIGNQCWMKENLRTTTRRNGVGNIYTNSNQVGYNAETYGYYYDWAAVMQGAGSTNYPASGSKVRGICPEGWHVPSDAEWTQLTTYVKLQTEYVCEGCSETDSQWYTFCIAKALSQPTEWSNPDTGCNAGNTGDKANATGFSAVPAGGCFSGDFDVFGDRAYFWSATQYGDSRAWYRDLSSDYFGVYRYYIDKDFGHSVRCLRD